MSNTLYLTESEQAELEKQEGLEVLQLKIVNIVLADVTLGRIEDKARLYQLGDFFGRHSNSELAQKLATVNLPLYQELRTHARRRELIPSY